MASNYAQVNVLVNCAGVCLTGPFEDTTLEDFSTQMQVNRGGFRAQGVQGVQGA